VNKLHPNDQASFKLNQSTEILQKDIKSLFMGVTCFASLGERQYLTVLFSINAALGLRLPFQIRGDADNLQD
jgi:hypothetical protein